MTLKKSAAFLLIFSLIFSLAACSGKEGEDFYFPIDSVPKSLDPQIADSKSADIIINNCFEGLVRINENGDIVPGVAEKWTVSPDGLFYTFHLRNNSSWRLLNSNKKMLGEEVADSFDTRVTAHDFVYAFKRALSPETNSPDAKQLFGICNAESINSGRQSADSLGVVASGDYVLKISLKKPDADFLTVLTKSICMPCNEAFFLATKGKYGLDVAHLLCNGPFYLRNLGESSATLVNNSDSYKGDFTAKPASVYLYLNTDPSSVYTKFAEGTYDASFLREEYAGELDEKVFALTHSQNTVWSLCFNCAEVPEKLIRLALFTSFDASELSFDNKSETPKGILPDCCVLGRNDVHAVSGNAKMLQKNKDAAVGYWTQALKELDVSQYSVTLLCTPEFEPQMRSLIQIWQQVFGLYINVKIESVEEAELIKRISTKDFQLTFAPLTSPSSRPYDFLDMFTTNSKNNFLSYSSSAYDSYVSSVISSATQTEAAQKSVMAEQEIINSAAVYPLICRSNFFATGEDVSGIYAYPALENVFFAGAVK